METQISTSENYTLKAWHCAAVLLSIGRPVSPAELAGKCEFIRISPEDVEFLCYVPNSPIYLTKNDLVLLSTTVFRSIGDFVAISVPKVQIGVFCDTTSFCGGSVVKKYFRRRKKFAKGKEVVRSIEGNELRNESFDSNDKTVLTLNALSCGMPWGVALRNLCDNAITPSMDISTPRLLELQSKKDEGKGSESKLNASLVDDMHNIVVSEKLQDEHGNKHGTMTVIDTPEAQAERYGPIFFETLGDIAAFLEVDEPEPMDLTVKMDIDEPEPMHEPEPMDQHDKNTSVKAAVAFHPHEDQVPEKRIEDMVEHPLNDYSFHEQLAEKEQHASGSREVGTILEDTVKSPTVVQPTLQEDISVNKENDQALVPTKPESGSHPHEEQVPETMIEDMVEQPLNDNSFHERAEKEQHSSGSPGVGSNLEDIVKSPTVIQPTLQEDISVNKESEQALIPAKPESGRRKLLSKFSAVSKNVPQIEPTLKQKAPPKLLQSSKVDILRKDRSVQKDQDVITLRDNNKQIVRNSAAVQEKCADKSLKDQQKKFPEFESYTVEEEEGSGGYGTVYRARRKTDGVTFAIKCPHAKAHIHHLKNELKMLQRFGGKNFVIKYEGSLKSGSDECFVLEHVEHDRPEILKREIDIYQLQWYGYCLFKALSSLHKQGVFHRDIKPGNFLFSCKTSKGYLIDFNLAKDIHKQPGSFDQSQPAYVSATENFPVPQHRFASPSKRRKILKGKPSETLKSGVTSRANHNLMSKTLKRKAYDDFGHRNLVTSQGGEGSGLTSKDLTSTRNSGERLREPVPCQGRKELINLAQEAMKTPNIATGSGPHSKRKRIAASPVLMDRKLMYLTPTPLHSSGNCVSGAGSWKNKGVKPPKEGPCVGTKGFRAPEVLLRSSYQDPKIDVWSAGVTLLYLITGKMPFSGDPEQNMKDIVKMKGNEELWEVAKLHNRESSFPKELLDIRFLQSTTVKEWCFTNTKRVKFNDAMPASLFDLIEKCLTVNPRLRITAEEAFRHEFFAPCHDALQSIKLRRLSQYHPVKKQLHFAT